MPSFLKDISKFYGNGQRNQKGESLEAFLEAYDPYKYKTPSCTTDAVVFSYEKEQRIRIEDFKILLVKRSNHPSIGYWALPGGFVNLEENLEDAARRELEEETGVQDLPMEQFAVYGDFDRDPRTRIITTAYMAIVKREEVKVQAGDDAADAAWFQISIDLISKVVKDQRIEEEYELHVSNFDMDVDTKAKILRTTTEGMIREEKFRVLDTGKIACDHGAIITQAILLLKSRL